MEKKHTRLWSYFIFPKEDEWSTSVWRFECLVPDDEALSRGRTIVQLRHSLQKLRTHGLTEPWTNN